MTSDIVERPAARLPTRRLGDLTVSAIGYGAMQLSHHEMREHRDAAIATLHTVLDAGVTLIDTADVYAPSWDTVGHNETLVAEALAHWDAPQDVRRGVVVATKGGITRAAGSDRSGTWGRDSSLDGLRRAAEASARRLELAPLPLYQHHRTDPTIPYETQVDNVVRLKEDGLIARIGLSNVSAAQLERALAIAGGPDEGGIVSVQNERSPTLRADDEVLARATDLGIAYLPWCPFGGLGHAHDLAGRHATFARVAATHGVSVHALTLAWLLDASPTMVPIPGARRATHVLDGLAALTVTLTPAERAELDASPRDRVTHHPDDHPPPPWRE